MERTYFYFICDLRHPTPNPQMGEKDVVYDEKNKRLVEFK